MLNGRYVWVNMPINAAPESARETSNEMQLVVLRFRKPIYPRSLMDLYINAAMAISLQIYYNLRRSTTYMPIIWPPKTFKLKTSWESYTRNRILLFNTINSYQFITGYKNTLACNKLMETIFQAAGIFVVSNTLKEQILFFVTITSFALASWSE